MFNWSLSNNLTKWGGSPFCWLLQTVEKLLREPAWVAAGLSTNTQSQCQIQTQICKQVNSVADCRLWRNRLCGYNWRPSQPGSSDSCSDLSIFLFIKRIAQLGPNYIQLAPLKYFEKKMKLLCRVRTGEALHTFKLHFCHVTEKWIFTDNFLLSVLVYFLQNQEGNTSTSHETWARLFFLNFLDCNFIQN